MGTTTGWIAKVAVRPLACCLLLAARSSIAEEAPAKKQYHEPKQLRQERHQPEAENITLAKLAEAERLGIADAGMAARLKEMAGLYHSRGRLSEAEPLYRRALAIWESRPQCIEVATALSNLARLCLDQEKYDEAELLSRRALGISEAIAPKSPRSSPELEQSS